MWPFKNYLLKTPGLVYNPLENGKIQKLLTDYPIIKSSFFSQKDHFYGGYLVKFVGKANSRCFYISNIQIA